MKGYTIYKSLLLMAAPLMLASCSNSEEPSTPSYEFGDFEGIMLNVPYKVSTNTRADETLPISAEEAKISSLTVFAYDQADGKKNDPAILANFTSTDFEDGKLSDTNYKQLPVVLPAGKYHIYVVANITADMLNIENCNYATITESDLQGAHIKEMTQITTIGDKGLPMSCNYDVVKPSASGNPFADGNVTITKKKTTAVYADLTYAVAKVRYTILNGANSTLRMNNTTPVKLNNYATEVGLMTGIQNLANNKLDDADLTGKYYAYPENFTSGKDANVDNLGNAVETPGDKWIYQGLVYVPEHLFGENDSNPTQMAFKFSDSQYDANAIQTIGKANGNIGVKRGVYYDVLGYLSSKDLTLEVKVKEWQYHKYTFDLGDDLEADNNTDSQD